LGKKEPVKEKSEVMPCQRCGVCCTSHQAFVTTADIERIIAYLGITLADWDRLYDDTRWQYSEYRLIKHTGGACVFLRFENGLATCAIHDVKPACCAAWQPGRDKKECREGMRVRKGHIRRPSSGIKT
jgi:Fe-S-cluster containining protein